jgi:hypothetical protein
VTLTPKIVAQPSPKQGMMCINTQTGADNRICFLMKDFSAEIKLCGAISCEI